MKPKNTYSALAFLTVMVFATLLGSEQSDGYEVFVLAVATLIIWWLLRLRKGALSKNLSGTTKKTSKKPSKVRTTGYHYVDQVAADLRETARKYEDPHEEVFFRLGGIQIRRLTRSQDFTANAFVQLGRNEFVIDFVNVNSRNGKTRRIHKKWKDTTGVLENRFELYFKDDSSIDFVPLDLKSHLYLSVFWQVFHEGLNGGQSIFQNPVESGLGHRLREVATYLSENKKIVGPKAAIDVSSVPTRIGEDEFFGFLSPRFPELRDKIKRWRLIRKIGAGGFGQVFEVEHVDTGKMGAIKLMSPTSLGNKEIPLDSPFFRGAKERFLDEATLSMKVNSPFVVSAIDGGSDPWPWILYPLVNGQPVLEALKVAPNQRAAWWNLAHDLISGLSTVHHEGLLHKDVKLDNMLYAGDRFVLLDFGIGEVVGYSELIEIGRVGGTFGYMAPELLLEGQSESNPSYAIDVFSAGMTLLSVFDQRPLAAMREAQHLSRTSDNREPLVDFMRAPIDISGAPEETRSLLGAMVDFDPQRRPEAKKLLKYVADFVDLDEKIALIDAQKQVWLGVPIAEAKGTNERDERKLEGPHQSWKAIEDEIHRVLESVRPEYFIIEINGDRERDMVYVQAITDAHGWHVEAMSEAFSVESQTTTVKRNFMKLNWTPPTASDPNFSVDLDAPPHAEIVRLFTDAFEFGYAIVPRDIRTISITTQGTGKY